MTDTTESLRAALTPKWWNEWMFAVVLRGGPHSPSEFGPKAEVWSDGELREAVYRAVKWVQDTEVATALERLEAAEQAHSAAERWAAGGINVRSARQADNDCATSVGRR